MKRTTQYLLSFCMVLLASVAKAQPADVVSKQFMERMGTGKAGEAYFLMDSVSQKQLSPVQLGLVWQQVEAKFGSWKSARKQSEETIDGKDVVNMENDFQKAIVVFKIIINDKSKVVGFRVGQVKDKEEMKEVLPAGIKEEEVTINANGGHLRGTIAMPDATTPVPVVLIIAGSGPTDRDGNSVLGISAKPYKLLAHELAKQGIASLRYDKRDIGASTDFGKESSKVTIEDYADDATRCIRLLKGDKRFSKVIVCGHSEGALIGMLASETESPAGYISLCGMGQPLDKTLDIQIGQMNPSMHEDAVRVIKALKKDTVLPAVPEQLQIIFNRNNALFIHSVFQYDPATLIRKVKVPAMIIGGNRDIQIREEDTRQLGKANPKIKLVIIDKMNHALKEAPQDIAGNAQTYSNPALPIVPELTGAIAAFVKQ